ncbi:MAG: shikimate kinase [Bacteroidetes bacterium HGW-Bacteroidetes-3]|jgi:shikimate kinase|nr:MAG: shikimate kinase [Bacteroidetes bacterium HGW-Bacteroidetes-3]
MKIVLLGYMASGKSVIGRILSKKLDLQFVDLDTFIEEKEQLSIPELFETKGEIYFRKKEGEYLLELLNLKENAVISLGGGTPCYGNNMEFIKNKSTSFYLKGTIDTIFERLKNETSQRPLVATIGMENLKEYIAKHLFERAPYYEKSDHIILINQKSVNQIVDEIMLLR